MLLAVLDVGASLKALRLMSPHFVLFAINIVAVVVAVVLGSVVVVAVVPFWAQECKAFLC